MLKSPRVMIASAYGRGHWMAVELHRLGFNVQLVDVTSRLGKSRSEDQDGPFGYFVSPRWQGVETEVLNSFGSTREISNGFSLWLKSGPWELRGPSTDYRAESLKQPERTLHFVQHYSDLQTDRKGWIEKLSALEFDRRWIASIASDLASNQSQWPNEAYQKGIPASLFEKYFSRNPEKRSLEASLKWCSDQGVVVTDKAEIPDLALEHRRVQGVEINSEKSGFVRCHQLIWMLTSTETEYFSPRSFAKIYKSQKMEPEWCWLRYQLEFEDSRELHQLPDEFLFIEDLNVPWAHDNYVVFRRSSESKKFHVWMRLPYSQRFHREYLADRIKPLLENIKERCPRLKGQVVELPQEAESHSKDLGAPLFPIYRAADLANPAGISIKNLWFSHPERWPSYSWPHIIASQGKIISQLRHWWGELSEEQKQKELQL